VISQQRVPPRDEGVGHNDRVRPTAPAPAATKLGYRPSLDGVRALAVIAVVLYHADVSWLPGGFLGVEVFFVVSGFLITALLVEERHHTGSVSLRAFWTRRARRLLPALYALLIVVPAMSLVFFRDAAGRLLGDVVAAVFYVSNWWQIFQSDSYFAEMGRPPVLRHLWSLAVEEQFYILFPLFFVLLITRLGRNGTRNVLVAGALASAVWMAVLYEPGSDPTRAYYGTDTRLSGLLLGATLAVVWAPWRTRGRPSRAAGPMLDGVGLLSLVALGWFLHRVNTFDPFIYRGGFLLLDVVCVLLIAVLVHPAARLSRPLAWAPLVWIGVRSYSIYLWHWPIFMFTRPELDVPLSGWPLFALRMVLTLVAAELSFRFVEQPIRNGAIGRTRARLRTAGGRDRAQVQQALLLRVGALTAVVALLSVGMWKASTDPRRQRLELEAAGVVGLDGLDPTAENLTATTATTTTAPVPVTTAVPTTVAPGASAVPTTAPPTTAPVTVAPPGTTATDAVAVGDSVMLGASGTMAAAMPGIRVDAKVARQFDDIASAAEWYAAEGYMNGDAIIHIGNNGVPQEDRIEQMVQRLGDRRILLVTAKVERPWQDISNQRTAAVAERHDNVVLVDWHGLSSQHPEWFAKDGTHLRPDGQRAYAELIRKNLSTA
jgi:peptidoglycan/LPS O-acetylase OafA/YrhL